MALSDQMIFTQFEPKGLWTGIDPHELADLAAEIDPNAAVMVEPNGMAALKKALSMAQKEDIVWVTGSLYLVGELREYWFPTTDLLESLEG